MRPHGGPKPLQGLELHGVGGLGAVTPKVVGAGPCVWGDTRGHWHLLLQHPWDPPRG